MSIYDVCDFGAVCDGQTNDAAAIQKTIDHCNKMGGGTVLFPSGKICLAGTFELRSNVELHIERGAILRSATNEEDFPHHVFPFGKEAEKRVWIRAQDADNIALTGAGTIDGQCLAFATRELPYIYETLDWRPAMTCFKNCNNIRIRNLTLKDSANWCLHFVGCEDIVVHGVTIRNNLKFPNSDGIDPDHCRNVRISDCYIETGDDCIVLKNSEAFQEYGPTENITVTGCTLVSTSAAIKIGTDTVDDFRNIVFNSCTISRSHRGISIQLRDQGTVENVLFSNMTIETRHFDSIWWGAAEPIYITAFHRKKESRLGKIRNVRFHNILCRSENGIYICGSSDSRIENVVLDNIELHIDRWTKWEGGFYDCRPCEIEKFDRRRIAGIMSRHATGITIRNCDLRWGQNITHYFGHAIESCDTEELNIKEFNGQAAHSDTDQAILSV